MAQKGVYLIRYNVSGPTLTVEVDGKPMPMDEFVQTHDPVQVTSLTQINSGSPGLTVVGLMIAEGKKEVMGTWGR